LNFSSLKGTLESAILIRKAMLTLDLLIYSLLLCSLLVFLSDLLQLSLVDVSEVHNDRVDPFFALQNSRYGQRLRTYKGTFSGLNKL
jgi:hypothetical protein